jgi:hypothetical protein
MNIDGKLCESLAGDEGVEANTGSTSESLAGSVWDISHFDGLGTPYEDSFIGINRKG